MFSRLINPSRNSNTCIIRKPILRPLPVDQPDGPASSYNYLSASLRLHVATLRKISSASLTSIDPPRSRIPPADLTDGGLKWPPKTLPSRPLTRRERPLIRPESDWFRRHRS